MPSFEPACLWALVYGHREFVALIGSDEEHAANMLDSIKAELENNDLLLEDFPEVVFPNPAAAPLWRCVADGGVHGDHQSAAIALRKRKDRPERRSRNNPIGVTVRQLNFLSRAYGPGSLESGFCWP